MNKFFTSIGLATIGASALHAQTSPQAADSSKFWNVGSTLRGFYDDNYTILPSSRAQSSFGIEVGPQLGFHFRPTEQTTVAFSYLYNLKWYEDRKENTADHSHQINGKLEHQFSERFSAHVEDSFVIAQEPEILNPGGVLGAATLLRSEGSNIRNTAIIGGTAELSQLVGVGLDYGNTFYAYEQKGPASRSALLDRMEQEVTGSARYYLTRSSTLIGGYTFRDVDYTSGDSLLPSNLPFASSELLNKHVHRLFVGVDQTFNPRLTGQIRVGGQYTDYYNQNKDRIDPYADVNLMYRYGVGRTIQLGLRHDRNQTEQIGLNAANLTLDQESTSVYANLYHQFTAKISGRLFGQYQHGVFSGGTSDGLVDHYVAAGMSLAYQINTHLMAETGYNLDWVESDINERSFTRNRVFIGISANY